VNQRGLARTDRLHRTTCPYKEMRYPRSGQSQEGSRKPREDQESEREKTILEYHGSAGPEKRQESNHEQRVGLIQKKKTTGKR